MKKYVIPLFLTLALLFCCSSCKKAPAKAARELIDAGEYQKAYDLLLTVENPNEEEKTLLSGFFFREVERISASGDVLFRCTYDEKGRLVSRHCNPDSYFGPTEVFTYDEKHNLLTWDVTDRDNRWQKTVWTYDENGNILTEEYSHHSYSGRKFTYTYDTHGNMLTMNEVINDPEVRWHNYVYTYDEKGNLVKEEYTYDGSFRKVSWHTAVYTHDEEGNILSKTTYHRDGTLFHAYTYTYDERNNPLSEVSDLGHQIYTYTYDEQGNILTCIYTTDTYTSTTVAEYDEKGRLICKIASFSEGEEYYREQYTYDAYGNIIAYYQKDFTEETGYESSWQLFYDPDPAPLSAQRQIQPEPVYSLKS